MNGTPSPKFVITDADGTKWKVKLGLETHPETAANRLVWAAGYYADEDYFLPDLQVEGIPSNLHRGDKFVEPNGIVHNARVEAISQRRRESRELAMERESVHGYS